MQLHNRSPKVAQIVERIESAIQQGQLHAGTHLPSVRQITELLGVGRATVNDAIDRLRAAGFIESQQGVGHFVARRLGTPQPAEPPRSTPDPLLALRMALLSENGFLRAGCGFLPEDDLPEAALLRAMRAAVRSPILKPAESNSGEGYLPLRNALRQKIARLGINAHAEQIVTTSGTLASIDLLLRLLLQPGDKVLLDEPGYFSLRRNVHLHGAESISIARNEHGLDMLELERLIIAHQPRVYVINSALHNPTGHSLPAAQASQLVGLARQYAMHIIEDDVYCDLQSHPTPRLAALGGTEYVSYISGFSKTLSPNIRSSYVVAHPPLAQRLTQLKLASGAMTSTMTEQIIYRVLSEGDYTRHINRVRTRLFASAQRVSRALRQLGFEIAETGHEGLFIWARLPPDIDAQTLSLSALTQQIALAPGSLFSPAQSARQYLRFNVAYSDQPALWQWLATALAQTAAHTDVMA